MKTILLIRHAKSDWSHEEQADFDRPLNKRGKRDAPLMGKELVARGLFPGLILCSPAKRAKSTVKRLLKGAGQKCPLRWEDGLYGAGGDYVLQLLRALDQEAGPVAVVGHNPCMEEAVALLCGSHQRVPTAAVAVFQANITSWEELQEGTCVLQDLLLPRELWGEEA